MKKLAGVIIGSISRTFEGNTYHKVTCLTADGERSFKSAEPVSSGVAILDYYPAGSTPSWTTEPVVAGREFSVCKTITTVEQWKMAQEMIKNGLDITL